MTTRQVLVKALDVLKTHGWCQGARESLSSGNHCAMGAIHVATTGSAWEENRDGWRAIVALQNAGAKHGIVDFNDARGRTEKQIHALFARAIKLATRKPRSK